jgi:hypothetical protein
MIVLLQSCACPAARLEEGKYSLDTIISHQEGNYRAQDHDT